MNRVRERMNRVRERMNRVRENEQGESTARNSETTEEEN